MTGASRPSSRRLVLLLGGSIAFVLTSCGGWGDQVQRRVVVKNRTSETITVEYLVGARQVGDRELRLDERQTIASIAAGEEQSFLPAPMVDGDCLAAPLVVLDEGGREIDRVSAAGTCVRDGDPVVLVVGGEDEG